MKRLMAIDYGTKRIGIALTDELQSMAHPFTVIQRKTNREVFAELKAIITEHEVERVIVGLPLNENGSESAGSEAARRFAQAFSETLGIPYEMRDERYTSLSADRILIEEADMPRQKRKHVRDKLAASFILESYLESRRSPADELI